MCYTQDPYHKKCVWVKTKPDVAGTKNQCLLPGNCKVHKGFEHCVTHPEIKSGDYGRCAKVEPVLKKHSGLDYGIIIQQIPSLATGPNVQPIPSIVNGPNIQPISRMDPNVQQWFPLDKEYNPNPSPKLQPYTGTGTDYSPVVNPLPSKYINY